MLHGIFAGRHASIGGHPLPTRDFGERILLVNCSHGFVAPFRYFINLPLARSSHSIALKASESKSFSHRSGDLCTGFLFLRDTIAVCDIAAAATVFSVPAAIAVKRLGAIGADITFHGIHLHLTTVHPPPHLPASIIAKCFWFVFRDADERLAAIFAKILRYIATMAE